MVGEVDRAVGERIRARRTSLSVSRDDLAGLVGVRRQQMQEYEAGSSRVGASRLLQIADTLDVPVTFFFEALFVGRAHDRESAPGNASWPDAGILDFAWSLKALPDSIETPLVKFLKAAEDEKTTSQQG